MMASMLPPADRQDETASADRRRDRIAGDRTSRELAAASSNRNAGQGAKGYVLMTHAGPDSVLTALLKPNCLSLIFLDVKRAAPTCHQQGPLHGWSRIR